jgi:RNA polymerase sigma-70 factor, ECF subfamily
VSDLAAIEPEPAEGIRGCLAGLPADASRLGDLREIYQTHAALAWRTLRRLGVHEAALEDALQDVFLVVHRRLPEFEGRATIKTWIYAIVLRVAKDHRRARSRHLARMDRLALLLTSDVDRANDPAYAAERHEANQLMHALLARLPEDLREVLVLVELEDLTIRQATESLGVNLRTGQRRLLAARKALDTLLANYLDETARSTP